VSFWWKKRDFENAVRYGDEYDIRQAAEELWVSAVTTDQKVEAAEFMSETLKELRPLETGEWFDIVEFDGIRIKRSRWWPELEIDGVDP